MRENPSYGYACCREFRCNKTSALGRYQKQRLQDAAFYARDVDAPAHCPAPPIPYELAAFAAFTAPDPRGREMVHKGISE